MISFADIQKRMRDLYDARFEPEGVRVLADIYWRTLLSFAVLVILLALLWGLWTLWGVFDVLAQAPDTSPLPPASLNRAALQGIVQGFNTRQAQFNNLQSNPPAAVPDPSK